MSGYRRVFGLVLVLLAAFVVAACGGSQKSIERASVKAGDMPEGASWSGVYYSQTYGHLHLIEEDGTVNGKWRTVNGDAWGEMAGEVTGDLFRYEWIEHKIGMVGPSASSKGHGYFKYKISANGVDPDEIAGEWGLGESEVGRTWSATKQPRMDPDPDSVVPDELERRGVGGGWDGEGAEKKPQKSPKGSAAFGTGEEEEEGEEGEGEEEDEGLPPPSTGPDSEY
jgi:hypothetical protein